MPAIVSSDASDFSKSVWIQSSDDFTQTSFMRILVDAAIERERQSHPKNEAPYPVLVKALRNQESTGAKVYRHAVEIIANTFNYNIRLSSYWMCYYLKYSHRIVTCGIVEVIQLLYTF